MTNFTLGRTRLNSNFNNPSIFGTLTSYILTYDVDTTDSNNDATTAYPTCGEKFASRLGRSQHLRQSTYCKILRNLRKFWLQKCPNINCNTIWGNESNINTYNIIFAGLVTGGIQLYIWR